jgi:CHAT domain-containing protein
LSEASNDLLPSLVPEARHGRPGKTRDAAMAAAQQDPVDRGNHLLSAVYASLSIGEPREALRLLDTIQSGGDESTARRARASRAWAQMLDGNWYPGNTGGELPPHWPEGLTAIDRVEPGDAGTMLVEGCAAFGPCMVLTSRTLLIDVARNTPSAAGQMLQLGVQRLETFAALAAHVQAYSAGTWALAAKADLQWRAGQDDAAREALKRIRQVCADVGDAIGLANAWMIEGDRLATPLSSPEALGFILSGGAARVAPPAPDEIQAQHAYVQAAAALAQADAPVARAAVELRLAFLAGRNDDFEAQRQHLDQCEAWCRDAGDVAGLYLVTVHRWLADIARGDLNLVRSIAPLEWAKPHGPVAEIADWAATRGSLTWCTGLGRLLQRSGEAFAAKREFESAEIAYRLAAHLVPLNGALVRWTIPEALATLDQQRGLTTRALVRHLQTLESLPPPIAPEIDGPAWMKDLEVTLGLLSVPSGVSGVTEIGIRIIERGEQRLNTLLDIAGMARSPDALALSDPQSVLAAAAAAQQAELSSMLGGQSKPAGSEQILLALAASMIEQSLLTVPALIALLRARHAERAGWDPGAEQWYRTSVERAASAGPEARWLEILILEVWGKRTEARAALDIALQERRLNNATLATLAVRVRAYEAAEALLGELPDHTGQPSSDWRDLTGPAEVASARGHDDTALALIARALDAFENTIYGLIRDADRVAACDDVSAAALYLLASRIHLQLAKNRCHDKEASAEARAHAFAMADRNRALALPREIPSDGPVTAEPLRRWQQAATEHATAYQRLLTALTFGDGQVASLTEVLSGAERALSGVEATLTHAQQETIAAARQVPAFTADNIRDALPAGTCLIEYQVVGRDYIVYAVTHAEIDARECRLEQGTFEGRVSRFVRACAADAASPEAEELASILLMPFSDILSRHKRVIIVPTGPLNTLPFHVLPFSGGPLGETHVVSYLPAASLLLRGAVDRPLAGGDTLVVGDPAFDQVTHPALPRLAGAAIEAQAVAAIYHVEAYVDVHATEASLRPLLRGRSLLHFAAHGRLDDIAPNTSSIVLAGKDELTVSDLVGLDLGADLAVLSACDTGRGTTTMGGDLVGLTRGLLAAGVRRSVVSLWPVDDVAACVTMTAFHQRLKRGTAPAQALAQAQCDIRRLSGAEIADRYRALGGVLAHGDRSLRRKGGSALRLSAFPEVDTEDDRPAESKDGSRTSIWAPFILVGA